MYVPTQWELVPGTLYGAPTAVSWYVLIEQIRTVWYRAFFLAAYSGTLEQRAAMLCKTHVSTICRYTFFQNQLGCVNMFRGTVVRVILIGELSSTKFRHFFRVSFQIFHIFLFFSPNIGKLTNLIFLVLGNFTNSDRTPPYIDTYLQLFPNFGNYGKNALR